MAWADDKQRVTIDGSQMAYVEQGSGDPIVFLHGNPTSSYLWRNVLILTDGPPVELVRSWPNLTEVAVPGLHFLQEDSADEIGIAIATWLTRIS